MTSNHHPRRCIPPRGRASKKHLLFLLLDSCFGTNNSHPGFSLLSRRRFKVKVPTRREESKDILTLLFRVLEKGYGREVGKVDLVTKFVFLVGFVDGEAVRSEDEVD